MSLALQPTQNSPMGEIPRATFLVSRVILAGRGSMNGPDSEDSETVLFENRPMSLWETLAELRACDELSCGHKVKVSDLRGSEYALSEPRLADG